ncbi:hypothetical protein HELRODRAFT_166283 [Helobdella robusta]|uniref:Uncharacterized protein n=1 Tax=Helobdella robusta TaxID=6412 RepID=T1EXZ3_HELRO|nr:hypothetical protein HELRODRAFT_166283 [Helobdella robusta]ESN90593.1 hypothetical protein HELRODRAFT_166283 [Helobdella robusta]
MQSSVLLVHYHKVEVPGECLLVADDDDDDYNESASGSHEDDDDGGVNKLGNNDDSEDNEDEEEEEDDDVGVGDQTEKGEDSLYSEEARGKEYNEIEYGNNDNNHFNVNNEDNKEEDEDDEDKDDEDEDDGDEEDDKLMYSLVCRTPDLKHFANFNSMSNPLHSRHHNQHHHLVYNDVSVDRHDEDDDDAGKLERESFEKSEMKVIKKSEKISKIKKMDNNNFKSRQYEKQHLSHKIKIYDSNNNNSNKNNINIINNSYNTNNNNSRINTNDNILTSNCCENDHPPLMLPFHILINGQLSVKKDDFVISYHCDPTFNTDDNRELFYNVNEAGDVAINVSFLIF